MTAGRDGLWSGFHTRSLRDRVDALASAAGLARSERAFLLAGGGLDTAAADRMSENVIGSHGLPLSVGLNFVVNDREFTVPMAVEEPSVVAAASSAAKRVRACGGFHGEADPPVMTAQVQLDDVPNAHAARERLVASASEILAAGDAAIPRMVARGGGCRALDVRVLDADAGVLVVDLYVDVGDAMGANLVDAVAETVAPLVLRVAGGRMGLRILSNLPMRRRVRVWADVSVEVIGGEALVDGIARASRFAELDPFRAVTHNKGFMNGLDAAAVALGQDWRSIEAAAHGYASLQGTYRPLCTWRKTATGLRGAAELPLAVGTVGGSTRAHEGVRTAFRILGELDARTLAIVLASVGLASNLAALRALAGEGIQRGHMRLHRRKFASDAQRAAPASVGDVATEIES